MKFPLNTFSYAISLEIHLGWNLLVHFDQHAGAGTRDG
jgi:hypothetical protein